MTKSITVQMLKTIKGVDKGSVYPKTFLKGEEYVIGESLFEQFRLLGAVSFPGNDYQVVKANKESYENKMNSLEGIEDKSMDLSVMTKHQIEEFALSQFGVDVDKRKKKADLIKEVEELMKGTN